MAKQIVAGVGLACTFALSALLTVTGCSSTSSVNLDAGINAFTPFGTGGTVGGGTGSAGTSVATGTGGRTGTGGSGGTGGTVGSGGATATTDAGGGCRAASCTGGTCCGGACTATQTDRQNCGSCGNACTSAERCVAGACKATMCSGVPGDPVNDNDGGTNTEVVASNGCPPNETCVDMASGGQCQCGTGPGCPPDETCSTAGSCMCGTHTGCAAGQGCCGDSCIDVQSDESNCGACGKTCSGPLTCQAGRCACPHAGDKVCRNACVDTMTDEQNCGQCGVTCATGASCVAGECSCDTAGDIACNGRCVPGNTNTNCATCGTVCAAPSTCRDPSGSLPLGCYCSNVNLVPCHGSCVALGTTQNCGSCDDVCNAPANTCRNQRCECPTAGETACNGTCVNLNTGVDTDPSSSATLFANCGACGVTCLANATCSAGACSCPGAPTNDAYCDQDPITGVTDGDYMCIPVTTLKNCGGCGKECLDDSECRVSGSGNTPSNYSCVCKGADAGKTHCAGLGCKDLTTDVENCGACGTVCATGNVCCASRCVNPDTGYNSDRNNCGSCGNACPNIGCGFLGLGQCNCTNKVCN